jgi:spore germination protein YaaH
MLAEKQGGQFSTSLCPTQTEGAMKAIVFTSPPNITPIVVGDALQAGVQVHIYGSSPGQRSESNLQGVSITTATTAEMNAIHKACLGFIR